MGIYDNAPNATFSEGGNYLNPGHRYLLEMLKMEAKFSRKGFPITVTEWRVHESDDPQIRPGAQASWVPNMQHELSLGNVMMMVGATSGKVDPDNKQMLKAQIDSATLEYCAGPAQPLKGRMVEVVTENITTKEKGQPFTKHRWIITSKPPVEAILKGMIQAPSPQQPSSPVTGAYGPASMFGGSAPSMAAPQGGALFGQPPAPGGMPSGGGLFGAPVPQMPQQQYAPQMPPQQMQQQQYAPQQGGALFGAPAPQMAPPQQQYAPQQGAGLFGGAPPPMMSAPQVPAPQVPAVAPPAPVQQWVVHPHNPAYEYVPGTQQFRLRQE